MKPILFTFAFAATLAAQNFIQMSDPQFGMFTKDASFEHETVNFEFAIATANRLKRPRGLRGWNAPVQELGPGLRTTASGPGRPAEGIVSGSSP